MSGTLEFVLQSARAVMASLAMSYEVETGESVNEHKLKCMAENSRTHDGQDCYRPCGHEQN